MTRPRRDGRRTFAVLTLPPSRTVSTGSPHQAAPTGTLLRPAGFTALARTSGGVASRNQSVGLARFGLVHISAAPGSFDQTNGGPPAAFLAPAEGCGRKEKTGSRLCLYNQQRGRVWRAVLRARSGRVELSLANSRWMWRYRLMAPLVEERIGECDYTRILVDWLPCMGTWTPG